MNQLLKSKDWTWSARKTHFHWALSMRLLHTKHSLTEFSQPSLRKCHTDLYATSTVILLVATQVKWTKEYWITGSPDGLTWEQDLTWKQASCRHNEIRRVALNTLWLVSFNKDNAAQAEKYKIETRTGAMEDMGLPELGESGKVLSLFP